MHSFSLDEIQPGRATLLTDRCYQSISTSGSHCCGWSVLLYKSCLDLRCPSAVFVLQQLLYPTLDMLFSPLPNVDSFLADLTLFSQLSHWRSDVQSDLAIKFILGNEVKHVYGNMEMIKQQHKLRTNCQHSCVIGWCCFMCFDSGLCFRALHLNLTGLDVTFN